MKRRNPIWEALETFLVFLTLWLSSCGFACIFAKGVVKWAGEGLLP